MRSPEEQPGVARDRELVSPRAYLSSSPTRAAVREGVVNVAESQPQLAHPAARYLVHLVAPGWNVIGATAPWRPGVAIGHNDRVAWGLEPIEIDTQDIDIEPIGADATRVVHDTIVVKGRSEPFEYETELTARGVIIASDRANGRQFALRWTGFEPGGAPELAALSLDVARTDADVEAATRRWKMPPRRVVWRAADTEGVGSRSTVAQPTQQGRSLAAAETTQGPRRVGETNERREVRGDATAPPRAATRPPGAGDRGTLPTTRADAQSRDARESNVSLSSRAVFAHVLGVIEATRRRFNVGPLPRPRDDQPFRAVFDPRSWDASRVVNAPGQSELPDSPHFADLAAVWSKGEMVPLAFSDDAIKANAEATLTLVPRR